MLHDFLKHLSPLPRRVVPRPWEDVASLISRAARKMGYPNPGWILSPEGCPHRITEAHLPLLCWHEEYQILGQQLLLEEADLYTMTTHQYAPVLYPEQAKTPEIPFRFTRIPLPLLSPEAFRHSFLDASLTKVCPLCLNVDTEDVYDRLYWRMRSVFFCPVHRIRLRERCPQCDKQIPALRLDPFLCPYCQKGDYREPLSEPVAPQSSLVLSTSILLRRLDIVFSSDENGERQRVNSLLLDLNPPTDYFSLCHTLTSDLARHFSWQDILVLLLAVDAIPLEEALAHHDFFASSNEGALALFHTLFLDWPTQFFAVLDLLYRVSEPPFTDTQQTFLVRACKWLFHDVWENKEEGTWLRQAYQLHFQQYRSDQESINNARMRIRELSSQLGLKEVALQQHPKDTKQEIYVQPLPLPSKLVPFPWEDLTSVLCRAARLLNVSHPHMLLQQAPLSHLLHHENLLLPSFSQTYRLFGELLCLEEAVIYQLTLHRLADPLQCQDPHLSVPGRSVLRLGSQVWLFPETWTTSVCPRCLQEDEGYDRLYWMAHPVQICPLHCVPLIRECPTCHKNIPLVRPHFFLCPFCQGEYRTGVGDPVPEQSLFYAGTYLFSRAIGVPGVQCLSKQVESSPLFHMTPKDYVHLLIAIGYEFLSDFEEHDMLRLCNALQIDTDPALSSDKSPLQDMRTRGEMLFHFLFTNWPVHFFAFFDELYRTITYPYQRFNYVMYRCRKYMDTLFIRDTFPWLWQAYEQHWYQFQQYEWYRKKRQEEDASLAGITEGLY